MFSQRGYTLVEVMVSLSILAIMAVIMAPLMKQAQRYFWMHRAKTEIQRDARLSLETVNRFLRQAYAASVVVDQLSGQPSHSRITFTTIQGRTLSFYQRDNTLYQAAGSTSTLSDNLRFIAFSYPRSDDASILSVSMTMEKSTYEGKAKALELSIEKVRVMN